MVAITVMAAVPITYSLMRLESSKDSVVSKEYALLREHKKAIKALTFLFLGFVAGYFLWFVFSSTTSAQQLFRTQIETITAVNTPTGAFHTAPVLLNILFNNIRILFFTLLFSLFFGSGGIFIMSWNASVMATAIGTFFREALGSAGLYSFAAFAALSSALVRYLTHGVFEILAYFLVGLAGGIIYNAVVRQRLDRKVMLDTGILVGGSILLLAGAAVVEVYLTPTLIS